MRAERNVREKFANLLTLAVYRQVRAAVEGATEGATHSHCHSPSLTRIVCVTVPANQISRITPP
jgi:hypothetical protein